MNSGFMNLPRDTPLVQVHTTTNRGFTPEEVAARCADRLMSVADTAPLAIREQALAFKNHIERVVAIYMREAIASDRTTVYNALKDAGRPDLADLIRRL
jgi:hypothetical protein